MSDSNNDKILSSPMRKLLTKNKKKIDNGVTLPALSSDIDLGTDDGQNDSERNYLPPSLRVPEGYSPTHSPSRPPIGNLFVTHSDDSETSTSDEDSYEIDFKEDKKEKPLSPNTTETDLEEEVNHRNEDEIERENMRKAVNDVDAPRLKDERQSLDPTISSEAKENNDEDIQNVANIGISSDNPSISFFSLEDEHDAIPAPQNKKNECIVAELDAVVMPAELPSETALATNEQKSQDILSDEVKENIKPDSELSPQDPHSPLPLTTINSPAVSPNRNTTPSTAPKVKRSILRASSVDRAQSRNNPTGRDNTNAANSGKKAVSFADENGGIISEQQTIDVSPSKLSRRVRRGSKALPSAYDNEDDEMTQKGVMGRVLVLLMDPPTKQYELTSLPYPLVSNDNGVVGPTKLSELLRLAGKSASFEPLRKIPYLSFMRPEDTEPMDKNLNILDYKFVKDEVLIAIPEGYDAEACGKFSYPILQDKRLLRLLKKLKKHERKAEKKRRLKGRGMKPNRSGSSPADRSPEGRAGILTKHGRGASTNASSETKAQADEEHGMKWSAILFGMAVMLILVSLLAGSASVLEQKKMNESIQVKSMQDAEKMCGRGMFCKPFGVKSDEFPQKRDQDLISKLREGIRKWNLEGDDLMM